MAAPWRKVFAGYWDPSQAAGSKPPAPLVKEAMLAPAAGGTDNRTGTGQGLAGAAALGAGSGSRSATGTGLQLAGAGATGPGVGTRSAAGTGQALAGVADLGPGNGTRSATGTGASLAGSASLGLGVGSNPSSAVATVPAVSGWRLPAGAAPWRPGPAGLRLRVR